MKHRFILEKDLADLGKDEEYYTFLCIYCGYVVHLGKPKFQRVLKGTVPMLFHTSLSNPDCFVTGLWTRTLSDWALDWNRREFSDAEILRMRND